MKTPAADQKQCPYYRPQQERCQKNGWQDERCGRWLHCPLHQEAKA